MDFPFDTDPLKCARTPGSLADLPTGRGLDARIHHVLHPDDAVVCGPDGPSGFRCHPHDQVHDLPAYSTGGASLLKVRDWIRSKPSSQRTRIAALIQDEFTRREAPGLLGVGLKVSMYAVLIHAEPEDWCRAALRWVENEQVNILPVP